MKAWFILFGFKVREEVNLEVYLVILGKMVVIFNFMWSIALYAPKLLKTMSKSSMALLLAIFALWNTKIHIYIMNSSNEATNIEIAVDEHLGCQTTLRISYIDSYYCCIGSQ